MKAAAVVLAIAIAMCVVLSAEAGRRGGAQSSGSSVVTTSSGNTGGNEEHDLDLGESTDWSYAQRAAVAARWPEAFRRWKIKMSAAKEFKAQATCTEMSCTDSKGVNFATCTHSEDPMSTWIMNSTETNVFVAGLLRRSSNDDPQGATILNTDFSEGCTGPDCVPTEGVTHRVTEFLTADNKRCRVGVVAGVKEISVSTATGDWLNVKNKGSYDRALQFQFVKVTVCKERTVTNGDSPCEPPVISEVQSSESFQASMTLKQNVASRAAHRNKGVGKEYSNLGESEDIVTLEKDTMQPQADVASTPLGEERTTPSAALTRPANTATTAAVVALGLAKCTGDGAKVFRRECDAFYTKETPQDGVETRIRNSAWSDTAVADTMTSDQGDKSLLVGKKVHCCAAKKIILKCRIKAWNSWKDCMIIKTDPDTEMGQMFASMMA